MCEYLVLFIMCAGDWVEDFYGLQTSCPYQVMRHQQKGLSRLASCSAAADVWSLGNLLVLLALGEVLFPGDLDLVQDPALLQEEESEALLASVIRQAVNPAEVSCLL